MANLILNNIVFALIQILTIIIDIITFPVYFIIQKPWKFYNFRLPSWATLISSFSSSTEDEVTYRSNGKNYYCKGSLCKELEENGVDTIEKMFNFIYSRYKDRPCLGTRPIMSVEDLGTHPIMTVEERKSLKSRKNFKYWETIQKAIKSTERPQNGPAKKYYKMGVYQWMTYGEVFDRALDFGKGIKAFGYDVGTKVVIYADTRADWLIAAHGCFKFNYTLCTIYANLGVDGIKHGISQTASPVVIVSQELLPKLGKILPLLPNVKLVIVMEEPWNGPINLKFESVKVYAFNSILKIGKQSGIVPRPPSKNDAAVIMYTSGSTGVPKGVVQTHWNIVNAIISLLSYFESFNDEQEGPHSYAAFLPLAHILEFCAENVTLLMGYRIGYSSPFTLTDSSAFIKPGDIGDAGMLKPTMMAMVPLVVDRIYKGILAKVEKGGPFKSKLFHFCVAYRLRWTKWGMDTPLLNKLIFSNVTTIVGGRLKFMIAGGAPLAAKSHEFVRTVFGIKFAQGYGLTETVATATISDPHDARTGLVGPPLVGVDLKLVSWPEGGYTVHDPQGPRGEIVIGGNHVAKGYYNMPEKTAEDFFDGPEGYRWFKTGDIGHMLHDGNLKIIDRKKDLVKLQMGEYVSLGKVESVLKINPLVDSICVIVHPDQSFAVAIVVPDKGSITSISKKLGILDFSIPEICKNDEVKNAVCEVLWEYGREMGLEKFEVPKKITLVLDEWTPQSGLVTAAMKLKRKEIEKYYLKEIQSMYNKSFNLVVQQAIQRHSKISPA